MITFHGITDFGEDNGNEPFLGVISDGQILAVGPITGEIKDVYEMWAERPVPILSDFERQKR